MIILYSVLRTYISHIVYQAFHPDILSAYSEQPPKESHKWTVKDRIVTTEESYLDRHDNTAIRGQPPQDRYDSATMAGQP